jgi:proteasome lid subunit RPN8/RPN11
MRFCNYFLIVKKYYSVNTNEIEMAIQIGTAHIKIIFDRAEAVYPEECCGILLGKIFGEDKLVVEAIATENAWDAPDSQDFRSEDDRTNHSRYLIPPQAIFEAQKYARAQQLEIIGFFHSHPDAHAVPSECDRSLAWEIYSYPIVSVINGKVDSIASWILDSQGIFQPEELKILEVAPIEFFGDRF